jgi:hypothetical protein
MPAAPTERTALSILARGGAMRAPRWRMGSVLRTSSGGARLPCTSVRTGGVSQTVGPITGPITGASWAGTSRSCVVLPAVCVRGSIRGVARLSSANVVDPSNLFGSRARVSSRNAWCARSISWTSYRAFTPRRMRDSSCFLRIALSVVAPEASAASSAVHRYAGLGVDHRELRERALGSMVLTLPYTRFFEPMRSSCSPATACHGGSRLPRGPTNQHANSSP